MKRSIENEKGSALTFTIVVFAVLMILATFLVSFMASENKMSLQNQRKIQAYYLARSGAVAVESAILGMKDDVLNGLSDGSIDVQGLNTDSNTVDVKLVKKGKELHIESTGTVEGKVTEKVTKVIAIDPKEAKLDMSIYSNGELDIAGSLKKIEGNIVVPPGVDVNGLSTLKLVREKRNYPLLDFAKIPNIINTTNLNPKTNGMIEKSTKFEGIETVTFNGTNVNAQNNPVDIIVNNLVIAGGQTLNISGKNKVRIFVKKSLTFEKNNSLKVNFDNGNKNNIDFNQLEIFCYNGEDIDIQGNVFIHANIYVNKALSITVNGNSVIGMIYAPEATIKFSKGPYLTGIIGGEVYIQDDIEVKIPKDLSFPVKLPTDLLKGSDSYGNLGGISSHEKGYFK